jgi:hypothetical protein
MPVFIRSLLLSSKLLFTAMLFSQEQGTVLKKKNLLQRMDSVTNWKLERGRSTLTPFISPSYTPETSVMLTIWATSFLWLEHLQLFHFYHQFGYPSVEF